jgi:hypothetical protein
MSSAVVSPSSFDVSNVSISALKLLPSSAKQAYLNYDSRKLTMQVGSLPVPYGMSIFDKAGPIKYSVDISLRGYEGENPKAKAIFDTFSALDEYMIQQGVKNSKTWFKQDLSRDVVKAFYTPCLRFSKDAEGNPKPYPPTIKVSLKQRDDKFETRVYDDKKREITELPMDEILVKGANITLLIECTGVWFAGSKYGISWKAVQIRVDSLPDRIRGFAFVDDGDATVPSTTTSAPKNRASAPAPAPNTFQALAADDEEEIDDEEVFAAAAPAPSPAPARTAAAAAAAAAFDDEADDVAPVAVPKKVTTVKKVVTKVAVAKK